MSILFTKSEGKGSFKATFPIFSSTLFGQEYLNDQCGYTPRKTNNDDLIIGKGKSNYFCSRFFVFVLEDAFEVSDKTVVAGYQPNSRRKQIKVTSPKFGNLL